MNKKIILYFVLWILCAILAVYLILGLGLVIEGTFFAYLSLLFFISIINSNWYKQVERRQFHKFREKIKADNLAYTQTCPECKVAIAKCYCKQMEENDDLDYHDYKMWSEE